MIAEPIVCPWCGQPTPPDYAHGHLQCLHCKTNIGPCCEGAPDLCESKPSEGTPLSGEPDGA